MMIPPCLTQHCWLMTRVIQDNSVEEGGSAEREVRWKNAARTASLICKEDVTFKQLRSWWQSKKPHVKAMLVKNVKDYPANWGVPVLQHASDVVAACQAEVVVTAAADVKSCCSNCGNALPHEKLAAQEMPKDVIEDIIVKLRSLL